MTGGDIVAIIPARGGSKGIEGKNLRPLAGKPMIAYTIEASLACPQIAATFVSTDDPAIASEAARLGADVIDRPQELSGDDASSESALLHALDEIEARTGSPPSTVVFLQATSPIRQADDLERALATFEDDSADSLFSAGPWHGLTWSSEGNDLRSSYDPAQRPRRQDLSEQLLENGSIYIFRPWVLRETGSRLGGKITVYRMGSLESVQVDEPHDIPVVESLLATQSAGAEYGTDEFHAGLGRLSQVLGQVIASMEPSIAGAATAIADAFTAGGKVLICGNGGSAADAQHLAAEFVGRMGVERPPLPALSLSSDPSVVTCIGNDYGFDVVFARQVQALGAAGDVLVAISTSGTSENIVRAATAAREQGMTVVSLTGAGGATLRDLSDHCLLVPTSDTQTIQEVHTALLHVVCAAVERTLGYAAEQVTP